VTPTAAFPAAAPADGGARRPLNPFLSKDPNQRAKRLARALVSDIITYHPAKHAEGLRDGTLKQLFREEIKKSFEEYIAQVGQQLAESTTYFQEALNEVLGAGKKIF
jgi:L-amino acid N-acyltransferase YncA